MICKCGATVKARRAWPRSTVFGADSAPIPETVAKWSPPKATRPAPPGPRPNRQGSGTIDVRSNEATITSGDGAWASLLRSNNIRRSKAVERIIG
jgi:hypothetical protein